VPGHLPAIHGGSPDFLFFLVFSCGAVVTASLSFSLSEPLSIRSCAGPGEVVSERLDNFSQSIQVFRNLVVNVEDKKIDLFRE
jgi:hypothetical protein